MYRLLDPTTGKIHVFQESKKHSPSQTIYWIIIQTSKDIIQNTFSNWSQTKIKQEMKKVTGKVENPSKLNNTHLNPLVKEEVT